MQDGLLVTGATLRCDQGSKTGEFTPSGHGIEVKGLSLGNESDAN